MIKIGSRKILFSFLALLLVFVLPQVAYSKINVEAMVDRNEMGLGDTVTLTVSVVSTESVDMGEPRLPDLDGFQLVNSWNSSSTSSKLMQGPSGMQFETVRRQDFNYMLAATKKGQLSIGSFEIVVEGSPYRTKPILIKVVDHPGPRGGGNQGNQALDDFEDQMSQAEEIFNQLLQRRMKEAPKYRQLPINPNEAFFVQVETDKTEAYEGEQITVNWYVYTRGRMESIDRVKFPDLRGFWKEIIDEVPALNFEQEVVNGVPYQKALVATHALFPIKPGTSAIDEFKLKSTVRLPVSNFGGFSLGPAYTYTKSSKRLEIKVKPLPVEGRPKDFSGAVGTFNITARTEGNSFPANQPFSLKVRFDGYGNAKLIDMPGVEFPPSLEQYSKRDESKFFKDGRSFKEFEILLIPRQEGEIIIPGISFSMFDPAQKKYISKTTQPIKVNITPGAVNSNTQDSRLNEADKKQAPTKIEIKESLPEIITQYSSPSLASRVFYNPWIWIVLYVSVILGLILRAKTALGWGQKKRNLKALVQNRIKKVYVLLDKNGWRDASKEMLNVYYFTLGEISGLGGANLEIQKLLEKSPPGLRRELGEEILKQAELLQTLSFAPEGFVGDMKEKSNLKKHLKNTESIILKSLQYIEETVES